MNAGAFAEALRAGGLQSELLVFGLSLMIWLQSVHPILPKARVIIPSRILSRHEVREVVRVCASSVAFALSR